MTAGLPSSWAAAHWPSSLPALRLLVANVMSTVSAGSGGVSRAMTKSPASRAFLMAALTPSLIGVMRMPLSPRAMASSMAVIWPWSSPSCLPEATVSLTLFLAASALAPFCMATKNGLVESLVMSVTPTVASPPPPPPVSARAAVARAEGEGSGGSEGDREGAAHGGGLQGAVTHGCLPSRAAPSPRDNVVIGVSSPHLCFCQRFLYNCTRDRDIVVRGRTDDARAPPCARWRPWRASASRPCRGWSTARRASPPTSSTRVERAVAQLGYRHNLAASNLRRGHGKTAMVGALLQDVSNSFSSSLLRSLEDAARDRDVVIVASSLDEEPERERALVEGLVRRRVDGLLLMPATDRHDYLADDLRSGLPIVFVDRQPQRHRHRLGHHRQRPRRTARGLPPGRPRTPADRVPRRPADHPDRPDPARGLRGRACGEAGIPLDPSRGHHVTALARGRRGRLSPGSSTATTPRPRSSPRGTRWQSGAIRALHQRRHGRSDRPGRLRRLPAGRHRRPAPDRRPTERRRDRGRGGRSGSSPGSTATPHPHATWCSSPSSSPAARARSAPSRPAPRLDRARAKGP